MSEPLGKKAKKKGLTSPDSGRKADEPMVHSSSKPKAAVKPRKLSADSDPILGTDLKSLRPGAPVIVIRDYHEQRPANRRQALPMSLNTSQPETVDSQAKRLGQYAGGMRWSPAFAEYIGRETTAREARLRANWRRWWENDYLRSRVQVRLGEVTMQALICLYQLGRNHRRAAELMQVSENWLARKEYAAWNIAHDYCRRDTA